MKRTSFIVLAAMWLATATPALAVLVHGPVWRATYVAAYQPTFGRYGVPYSGIMKLAFDHGIVRGTYVSDSIRPDPLYGRSIAVSGGSKDGHVLLNLSAFGGFTINGTINANGTISGTATIRGRLYNFRAKVKSTA